MTMANYDDIIRDIFANASDAIIEFNIGFSI